MSDDPKDAWIKDPDAAPEGIAWHEGEVLLPDGAHKYGMAKDLQIDKDGLMHAPAGPGLGGEIDFDLIKRKTEAVLS